MFSFLIKKYSYGNPHISIENNYMKMLQLKRLIKGSLEQPHGMN